MLLFLFASLLPFLLLLSSFSIAPYTHTNKRKKNKTKRRIKKSQKPQIKTQKKEKKREIMKTLIKGTQNRK
jgi:hypothetical protein